MLKEYLQKCSDRFNLIFLPPQRGQRFATYCDDASGGRYRVCQSNVPCGQDRHRDRQYKER